MKISEMIADRYKLRIPPTVYYELLADVQEAEEEQEPILDKIRNQIKSHLRGVEIALEVLVENDPLRPKMEGAKDTLEDCLELIDKYKEESEG